MTDYDHVGDLADRMLAKLRRGEDPEFEFGIEWGALTGEQQAAYTALVNQRRARGEEKVEAMQETIRVLIALAMLVVRSDAPPGTGLGGALAS